MHHNLLQGLHTLINPQMTIVWVICPSIVLLAQLSWPCLQSLVINGFNAMLILPCQPMPMSLLQSMSLSFALSITLSPCPSLSTLQPLSCPPCPLSCTMSCLYNLCHLSCYQWLSFVIFFHPHACLVALASCHVITLHLCH